MIHPFISGSRLVSIHSSHSSCNTFQLPITLCREPPCTAHLVGHNIIKSGNLGAKSSLNFLNKAYCFGEKFNSFKISEVVSRASLRFFTSLIISLTASCKDRMPISMTKNGSQLFGFDLSYHWQSPSPVTGKVFSVQWRGHKISFWVINYMPPNQKKKGTKWLVRDRNASILWQTLWK